MVTMTLGQVIEEFIVMEQEEQPREEPPQSSVLRDCTGGKDRYDAYHVWTRLKSTLKTQKARGLHDLMNSSNFDTLDVGTTHFAPHQCVPNNAFPAFARPCPLRPRHGFVDSRLVNNRAELEALWQETLAADPDAELIVMPRLSGKYSGIATHAGVTWGHGNDGVTAGIGNTVTIPFGSLSEDWDKAVKFTPADGGTAYIEIVEHTRSDGNSYPYAVQLREGPEQPTTKNYIPSAIASPYFVITDKKDESLMDWEIRVNKFAKDHPGQGVIWLKGKPLSSHYAVHGIVNGVPVVTDDEMPSGDLAPVENAVKPLTAWHLSDIRNEIFTLLPEKRKDLRAFTDELLTACATVHASSQWDGQPHLRKFRAHMVVILLKAALAATMGELRHWFGKGPGNKSFGVKRVTPWKFEDFDPDGNPSYDDDEEAEPYIDRDLVYRHCIRNMLRLDGLEAKFKLIAADFRTPGWDHSINHSRRRSHNGTRNYGYGGPKWAEVADAGARLARAASAFTNYATPENWAEVMAAANNIVHVAHNGGYAFNKWLSETQMNRLATAPGIGFLNTFAADLAVKHIPTAKEDRNV